MPAALASSGIRVPRMDPGSRESLLSYTFGVTATNPDSADTITIAASGAVYGLTGIMIIYAWCNYNYRPIKAKNLTWVTLIYLSAVLWYIGNIGANGHVWIGGVWKNCKLWVIWFRVLFCYIFATLNIVRFYALDRVFNQKKPFTKVAGLIAGAIVIIFNVVFCLINQLISGKLTVRFVDTFVVCDVTQGFRIAALVTQWILWAGCAVLIFRLRNIQSSFNEFRESVAIFAVIIALLTESTVTYIHFKYYTLEKNRRIQKTLMDTIASNLVVWLIVGYPVLMSIFRRHRYEQSWVERLAKDNNKTAYEFTSNQPNTTSYAKMHDNSDSAFNNSQLNIGENETVDYQYGNMFADPGSLRTDSSTLRANGAYNDSELPMALRTNLHIRRPVLNNPSMFNSNSPAPLPGTRAVL
ncbi:hypothetical protein H4R22_001582 [Coemansia sp. RSA 1290]|nr:hypothetical protein H4R22_001582 [Coemansia sp. RSA 1290]